MKGKLVPMIGLAVVFGGLSIFAADRWVKGQVAVAAPQVENNTQAQPSVEVTKIVVAKDALKYGTEITADLVQEIDWPANAVPTGAFKSIAEMLDGGKRVVLSAFAPNEPVLIAKLSGKDGRGSLANLLTPGMRAVTVRVDDITGVAGFVTAGDYVDVILTRQKFGVSQQSQPNAEGSNTTPEQTSELASEVILQNVKVLTLDQNADESSVAAVVAKAVTVEVTSEDAQKVALAQQLGTLYLLLRPAGEAAGAKAASISTSDLDGTKPMIGDQTASTERSSVADIAAPSASILTIENEGPKFRSLVVTRGHVPENYSVIDEQGNHIAPTELKN